MQKIPSVTNLRNILILRGEGSLGDAIISSCCYREIKQANPQIRISVVCFGAGYQFLKENPYIDRIIKLPIPKLIRPNQRWLTLIWYGIKLRKYHFDLVLDSSNKNYKNWRLFKWLVGKDRVLDCFTSPVRPFGAPQAHGSLHESAILQMLGIKNPNPSYNLPVPPKDQQTVQTWLTKHQLSAYVLLNPSGSVDKRRFSAQTLKRLAALLAPFKQPIIIPSMPAMYAHWQAATKDIPNIHVKKTESVFELFEWVRRATVVVTPDTSVVHIATGFNKPALVFYNTFSVYNAPNNPHALIVETDRNDVNNCDWALVQTQLEKLHTKLTAYAENSTK